ncbi:MAG: hypothetical protein WAM04_09555 [Candidatus Sulfotelmatobacter sp.]
MSLSRSPKSDSRKNHYPISLSRRLDHKLLGYTVAASAAGVGMMALAQPSPAEIVYTPTHQTVHGTLALDLNNNGVTDFTIVSNHSSCSTGPECVFQDLNVSRNGQNQVWVTYGGQSFAQALPAGKRVGQGDKFGSGFIQMDRCKATRTSYYLSGSWLNVKSRYLGLAFSIEGKTHYGWARFSVSIRGAKCEALAVLTGYAYETVPGKPILTGKTSGGDEASIDKHPDATLGALALGSMGLVAWRRDEDAEPMGRAVDSNP